MKLSWPSVSGRYYRILSTTNLAAVGFNGVVQTNLLATPPVNIYTDTPPASVKNTYYRLGNWSLDPETCQQLRCRAFSGTFSTAGRPTIGFQSDTQTSCRATPHIERKRSLSVHQKQIRFFTGLAMLGCAVLAAGLFWFLNRPGFIAH